MKYAKQLFRQEYFVICQAFQTINLQDFDDLVKAWQNLDEKDHGDSSIFFTTMASSC